MNTGRPASQETIGERRALASLEPFSAKFPFTSAQISSWKVNDLVSPRNRLHLDTVGLAQLVAKGHLFGARTLLVELERSSAARNLFYAPHSNDAPGKGTAVYRRIEQAVDCELTGYVAGKKSILVLLSGGLDSRILAGRLRYLQQNGAISATVSAATWGTEAARDVEYARKICAAYGWDWHFLPLTAERLRQNFDSALEIGAEVSPFHLHAMPALPSIGGFDVIVAGSYGDSVGRGEYSGRRVNELRPIWRSGFDVNALFSRSFAERVSSETSRDVSDIPLWNHEHAEEWQVRELGYQHHYMRRMMSGAMSVMESVAPVKQVFVCKRSTWTW